MGVIENIIKQLEQKEMSVFDVSEDYNNNKQIREFEIASGLRVVGKRGFDVMQNSFFVQEELLEGGRRRDILTTFNDFNSYYDFLCGDVYDNACYSFCTRMKEIIACGVDIDRLFMRKAFVEDTVEDYTITPTNQEMDRYTRGKRVRSQFMQWFTKLVDCGSADEFSKVVQHFLDSKTSSVIDVNRLLSQYITTGNRSSRRFSIIMEYLSTCDCTTRESLYGMCLAYDPQSVVQAYRPVSIRGRVNYKYKRKLKEYVNELEQGDLEVGRRAFFDVKVNLYCVELIPYYTGFGPFLGCRLCRYFESFVDFADFLGGDLRHCDLSHALECNVSFGDYVTDDTTKLPLHLVKNAVYTVDKHYRDRKFSVVQRWTSNTGREIKRYEHTFDYFFDFVAFLKGDLSYADLVLCDGLESLAKWDGIDFTGARLHSSLCEKFALGHVPHRIDDKLVQSFHETEQNEDKTAPVLYMDKILTCSNTQTAIDNTDLGPHEHRWEISYVSDLHLEHRIKDSGCVSVEDIERLLYQIAITISEEAKDLVLIAGDTSSDFSVFMLFAKALSELIPRWTQVIFVLGNHELWSFPSLSLDRSISRYRDMLAQYGMYLLHNDLLYIEDAPLVGERTQTLSYEQICTDSLEGVSERLRYAKLAILGGIGFAGRNRSFNADRGIYSGAVDRALELEESCRFENLYHRLITILSRKNTVVLTLNPKSDWCGSLDLQDKIVYVWGHTHRNVFCDDGKFRLYADNQIGYQNKAPHLKSFLLNRDYDCFSDYVDGVYSITNEQYASFYRGKNICMTYTNASGTIYMLKKKGYYLFITSRPSGICILNGGQEKRLKNQHISHYYDYMDAMVAAVAAPLNDYTEAQISIVKAIRSIGGSGRIHGCIVDIDSFCHVYINPIDGKVTGYWARDMVAKVVYPSVVGLVKAHCPELYKKYLVLSQDGAKEPRVSGLAQNLSDIPQIYDSTDIYVVSKQIKKLQKISSNILAFWDEDLLRRTLDFGSVASLPE